MEFANESNMVALLIIFLSIVRRSLIVGGYLRSLLCLSKFIRTKFNI